MTLPLFPRRVNSVGCGSGRGEEPGGEILRLTQDPLRCALFIQNLRAFVCQVSPSFYIGSRLTRGYRLHDFLNETHRYIESRLEFHKRPATVHPRAERNAFRRRDARQQSRLCALHNHWLTHSPKSIQLC